jgi:hypothetical protein
VARKVEGFAKGMLVQKRETWGDRAGQVDEKHVYEIKQIGPKQATLLRCDPQTNRPYGSRGHNEYLMDRAEAEQAIAQQQGNSFRRAYFWDWGQVFVGLGEAGWDPSQNY